VGACADRAPAGERAFETIAAGQSAHELAERRRRREHVDLEDTRVEADSEEDAGCLVNERVLHAHGVQVAHGLAYRAVILHSKHSVRRGRQKVCVSLLRHAIHEKSACRVQISKLFAHVSQFSTFSAVACLLRRGYNSRYATQSIRM
jgi:hypothetical protein